jgi:L-asparaginase/Glu-tRNA(Gln) amidotransferase subunit D
MDDNKELLPVPRPIVEVVYAGGTISSLATEAGHREGGHAIDLVMKLEEHSPDYRPTFDLGDKEIAYTGLSENIDEEYWMIIDQKTEEAIEKSSHGIFITHGTDSLEQTAQHLEEEFLEKIKEKNVRIVITASNDDIDAPETDAWDNLEFGLECSASDIEPGVYVAFHRRLIPASKVVKLPFTSGGESTFVSRDDPIYIETLQKQQEHSHRLIEQLESIFSKPPDDELGMVYDVNVIRRDHRELLDNLSAHNVRAIILNLYHSGTANTEKPDRSVSELVNKLRTEAGIVFFGVTENGEPVDLHAYETSVKLRKSGVVPLYDMTKEVALMKLRLLNPFLSSVQLIEEMLRNRAGEIDESRIFARDIAELKDAYS